MASFFILIFQAILVCIVPPSFSTDEARHLNYTSNRELLISSYQESLQIVDEAMLQRQSAPPSSMHLFTFLRQAEPETLEIARAAEVFQTTMQVAKSRARQRYKRDLTAPELLSWPDVELIAELSQCPPPTHPATCHVNSKYRPINGLCNNRQNPHWGAANSPLVRWLPAEYEDREREPKGWNQGRLYNGFQLPPPFEISKKITKTSSGKTDDIYSQIMVEWGQYIDHDLSFTPQVGGNTTNWPFAECVNGCENVHPCFPIQKYDMHSHHAQGCMPFYRSASACFVDFEANIEQALQRQQINTATSFLDSSTVYGSTPKKENLIRDIAGLNGKLAVNQQFQDPKGRPYLPFVAIQPTKCRQDPHGGERVECLAAGDKRANEVMPLLSLHTLSVREHNRIAEVMQRMNRHWSPEMIYQETRKIITAQHQIITMRDYLPKILGAESFEHYIGPYRGYDPTINPSVSNVFSTAAFRFGHATISPILLRFNESFQEHEKFPNVPLHQSMFSPWRLLKEGGLEPVLRGIIGSLAQAISPTTLMREETTERLVVINLDQHMDLASLDLQRGRDHALPGYNDWRTFCGLKYIKTLDDLRDVVGNSKVAEKIHEVYKHTDNIDIWLGGLMERLLPGARTGPLYACLIGKQMKAIRDGDRYWWEAEGIFTQQQRAELLKGSLSRLICDNTDIREIPYDAFRFEKYPSGYVSCNDIPMTNLEAWREEQSEDLQRCGSPAKIKNGDFILSSTSGKLAALYSCYHGFKLTGTAAIFCERNRWSDQPPQCTVLQ